MKKHLLTLAIGILPSFAMAANEEVVLSVPNMTCAACPITVKKALDKVPGMTTIQINFDQRIATVTYDDEKTKVEALIQATTNAGYPATVVEKKL